MWNYIDAFPTQDTSSAMGCFLLYAKSCKPLLAHTCSIIPMPEAIAAITETHWNTTSCLIVDIWPQARHVFERSCFSRGGKCCYVVCACPLWQHLCWVASRTRGNPWKTWHNNWAASCKGHSTGSVVREKQCMYHLCPLCKCNLFQRCLASYFTTLTAIGSVLNISINYHQLSSTN